VVFSLFGKKPPPKDAKPAKPQARSARADDKPKTPPPDASVAPDVVGDLDFTNWSPASPPPSEPPSLSPPPSVMPTIAPESMEPPSMAPASEAAKSSAPSLPPLSIPPSVTKATPTPPLEAKEERKGRAVDSILCIEVETGAKDVPTAIEETAILFANGQVREALARVSEAIASDDLGVWQLQAWLMLFDLYQHLGMRAEFEEKALDFVVKFERSPPVWADAPPPASAASPARSGGAGHVALSGALTAASAPHLDQVKKLAEKQRRLRIDFGRLAGVDAGGAKLLLDTFATIRRAGKEVTFVGDSTLVKLIGAAAKSGDRSVDPALWLLLLEIHQHLGHQQAYEDAALEYAITYEVSPPAWENRAPANAGAAAGAAPESAHPADEAFIIDGEVAGSSEKLLAELEGYAAAANPVVIDMLRARRVDFVNAGQLLNVLARIKQAGKSIEIRGANEMIVALFAMMGIREFARLVPRK
jgi:anti-anti-sigma regulatory factor